MRRNGIRDRGAVVKMGDTSFGEHWDRGANAVRDPKAQYQREVPKATIEDAPKVACMLGESDRSGVSVGASAAILCPSEAGRQYTDNPLPIKALSLPAGPADGTQRQDRDNTTFPEVAISATDACAQAGARNARDRISLAEVHDCFTPTELVLMEYPGASARGTAWRDTLDSRVGIGGAQPVNPDGGLMSFGHPIGASEFRMMYERWLRFRGESGPSQVEAPRLGLTQNLGKVQERCVGFVSVVRTN